jgi:hypothetical protein
MKESEGTAHVAAELPRVEVGVQLETSQWT